MEGAVHHLHTSRDVYEKQIQKGRYFLHEAPWGATSWKDERVERISSRDDVYVVRGPMCKWGMTATDRRGLQGTGFVRKETGWSTMAPPHPLDWWHSPASGKVSAAACKSCAQMFEKRTGRER